MKFSTKARYGLRALVELAVQDEKKPVLVRDIASRQSIPKAYLEQIINPLVNGGVLRSVKGPKGGILLNADPSDIQIGDVIQLLEGSLSLVDCVDNPDICDRSEDCVTRNVWVQLRDAMSGVLEGTTLQDLVDKQKTKEPAECPADYII
jgi:Rrf2 family cysteine metabolism transcriptional repressor